MSMVGGSLLSSVADFDDSILDYSPNDDPIFNQFIEKKPVDNVWVSLSGGVDSMVCSWLLSNMYPGRVTAIHVNYNNRSTSDEETRFVLWWCRKIGIPCYVRKLHEIKREPCMAHGLRSTYESYTRKVRFHCYKEDITKMIFWKTSLLMLLINQNMKIWMA